jgi:hypothetical protein
MNLWKRIKNVFTNELVEKKELIEKANELLDAVSTISTKSLPKEITYINGHDEQVTVNDSKGVKVVLPVSEEPFSFKVDWDKMGKPFSIERTMNDNGIWITAIGYWPDNVDVTSEPKEWFLFITKDQHEQLVEEYKEWLK